MTLGENKGCHARLAPPPSAAPTFQPVVIRSGRGRADTLALMLEHDKQVQEDRMRTLPQFLPSAGTPSCASPYCFDGTSFRVARSLQTFRAKRGIVLLRFAIARSCFGREHTPVSRHRRLTHSRSVGDGLSVRLIMVLGESN
jgi:hypothetical protein